MDRIDRPFSDSASSGGQERGTAAPRLVLGRALLLIGADFLAMSLALSVAALIMWQFTPYRDKAALYAWDSPQFALHALQVLPLALVLQLWFFNRGHYGIRLPPWSEAQQVVTGCFTALVGDGFLHFALKEGLSRLWVAHTWGLAVLFILLFRRLARLILAAMGHEGTRAILVGTPDRMAEVPATLSRRGLDYQIVASLAFSDLTGDGWPVLCRRWRAETVILAAEERDLQNHAGLVAALALDHIPFVCLQTLGGLPVFALDSYHLMGSDVLLLTHRPRLARPVSRLIKHLFDGSLASLATLLLLPTMAVLAMIVASDGGPVFYRGRRIGRDGRAFDCLKFRTMVTDGDRVLARHLARDEQARREWSAYQKLQRDPRVTRWGRLLRASSLDELPQLFNVLKGEMSLIGPRPLNEEEIRRLVDDGAHYKAVRPGITGLWQVSGRNTLTFAQRAQLDMWYVKNWSLWLDVIILLKTIPILIRRSGAY